MSVSGGWPHLEPYRAGNAGPPFVWSYAARESGPHVMINALTHGNEPCGAIALTRLLDQGVRPRKGRLTLSFANVEAYESFLAGRDSPARFLDRDLNRLWRDDWIDADGDSREAARARELRPFLATVDILLDLHSTASVRRPFFVIADLEKSRRLADRLAWPATQQLMPGGCRDGRHMIDYGRFSDPGDAAVAVTVECGRHEDLDSGDMALAAAANFMVMLDVITASSRLATAVSDEPIRRYRTTQEYIVRGDRFELLVPDNGFVAVSAGQPVAVDGGATVTAPFDATIIAPRPSPAAGEAAFLWAIAVD